MGTVAVVAASPALAKVDVAGQVARPLRYRGKLGTFEIITLTDEGPFRDEPDRFFAIHAAKSDVEAVLTNDVHPPDFYEAGFAPAIVNTLFKPVLAENSVVQQSALRNAEPFP